MSIKSVNQIQYRKAVKRRYKRVPAEVHSEYGFKLCAYCDLPADTLDHVPPMTWRSIGTGLNYHWIVVPACRFCNGTLGGKLLITMNERLRYLHAHYTAMSERQLTVLNWTTKDMANAIKLHLKRPESWYDGRMA